MYIFVIQIRRSIKQRKTGIQFPAPYPLREFLLFFSLLFSFSDIQFNTMFIQINVGGIVFVLSCYFDQIHFSIFLSNSYPHYVFNCLKSSFKSARKQYF